MSSSADTQIIPDVIIDTNSKVSYTKGRYFGKVGFAKCYEITDNQTKQVYAGKMVSKKLMMKHNQKDKMTQEITIHRSLNHKHVVGFHGFFEDTHNVYIILELRRRRMEQNKTSMHFICSYSKLSETLSASNPKNIEQFKTKIELNKKESFLSTKKLTPFEIDKTFEDEQNHMDSNIWSEKSWFSRQWFF